MEIKTRSVKIMVAAILGLVVLWSGFQLFFTVRADLYARKGLKAYEAQNYDQALKLYNKALKYGSTRSEYYYDYARTLGEISKNTQARVVMSAFMQEALDAYQRALKLNSHEGNYWVGLAHASWWLSKLEKHHKEKKNVELYLNEALNLDPANGKFLYAAINYYLAENRVDEALPLVERLAQAHPNSYETMRDHPKWQGPVQFSFQKGLLAGTKNKLNKMSCNAYLARMAADLKDWPAAIRYAKEAVRLSGPSVNPWWYSTLGGYYLASNKPDPAIGYFFKSVMATEDRLRSLNVIFWTFASAKNIEPFITLSEKVAEKDARVAAGLDLLKGIAYFTVDQPQEAEKYLKKSIESRETAQAHGYLARIALQGSDWSAAGKEAETALSLDSKESVYWYLLSLALKEQDRLLDALDAMNHAIELDKQGTDYYYGNRGWYYWNLKRPSDAIRDWKTASRLNPSNVDYYAHLGMAHKLLKDYSSAERYLQSALELKPGDQGLEKDLKALQELKLPAQKEQSKK